VAAAAAAAAAAVLRLRHQRVWRDSYDSAALVLGCDVILSSHTATFGSPEIKLGVIAPAAAILLTRRLGSGRAMDLLLTGSALPAEEAYRLGLVDRVLDGERFDEEASAYLSNVAKWSGPALGLTRRAVRLGFAAATQDALAQAEQLYLKEVLPLRDAEEGLKAFLEKRAPVWRDS
jgi:cyclohexa-1,5-dienecarbonyl-CoA hydratase